MTDNRLSPGTAAVPKGWKLVPERATQRQMDAGLYQSSADSTWADVYSIYADMIDVAPSIDEGNDPVADPRPVAQRQQASPQEVQEACALVADRAAAKLEEKARDLFKQRGEFEVRAARDTAYDIAESIRALIPPAAVPPSPVAGEEIGQHIAWLYQFVRCMNERNWRDMRDSAERQIDRLSSMIATRNLAESICDDCPPAGSIEGTRCLVCPRTSPMPSTESK